ncbi:MAG: OsmC family protein [Formosimonas sp.]
MAQYTATAAWTRHADEAFIDNQYSRVHELRFDNGLALKTSSSVHVVPAPQSDETAVDPEELFVASLSSCHMLWFLGIAAKKRFCVDSYVDHAFGEMSKNEAGKMAMTLVMLRPQVIFSGERQPSAAQIAAMHHLAHEECFIANSVNTKVLCEPQ